MSSNTRPAYPKQIPSVILLSFHRICQEYMSKSDIVIVTLVLPELPEAERDGGVRAYDREDIIGIFQSSCIWVFYCSYWC